MQNCLSEKDVESVILSTSYLVMSDGRTTICQLTLKNGFTVIGSSACVSAERFNKQKGEEIAFADAKEKVWVLEGYLLRQRMHEAHVNHGHDRRKSMDFGDAIRAMKAGKKVAREGWNGKGMWLSLSCAAVGNIPISRTVPASAFWSENNAEYARECRGGHATVLPCITMKTATGEILMGWLASQTDMLAIDWLVVE